MSLALKLVLAPLLLAQGRVTRRRALVLPEAAGPRDGVHGAGAPALDVLIAGDSSAAGVGVAHQDAALAGQLSRALHQRCGRAVRWTLRARSGVTTEQLHALLRADPPPAGDVAVIVTGVNDVVGQIAPRRAVAHRQALADWLLGERAFGHVVFAALPPIHQFPLLPALLRFVMGRDARLHDAAMARWARGCERVSHAPMDIVLTPQTMAHDGFHPGEPVYRACGEALAAHISAAVLPTLEPTA
jgi:lysophospholipase L1-like esterase